MNEWHRPETADGGSTAMPRWNGTELLGRDSNKLIILWRKKVCIWRNMSEVARVARLKRAKGVSVTAENG